MLTPAVSLVLGMHAHVHYLSSTESAIKAAQRMPLLGHHCRRGEPFNIMRSEVCRWLCDQPEIRQEIFNWVKANQAIVFVDGNWIGAATYAGESVRDGA
jgi:hypothetical protein